MDSAQAQDQALMLVQSERHRQVKDEGWTPEHDDDHADGSLATAAACYALDRRCVHVKMQLNSSRGIDPNCYQYEYSRAQPGQVDWPWESEWYVRTTDDRLRELTKAGALILAEMERLLRAQD